MRTIYQKDLKQVFNFILTERNDNSLQEMWNKVVDKIVVSAKFVSSSPVKEDDW